MSPAAIDWNRDAILARVQIQPNGCWAWLRPAQRDGYALIRRSGVATVAHKFVYELLIGLVPNGLTLDHACHTKDLTCKGGKSCQHRRCVNPEHMELLTAAENTKRSRKSQTTHCPQGHPYKGYNLILFEGRRYCRECKRLDGMRRREARRAS